MNDLLPISRRHAQECLAEAKAQGLRNVRLSKFISSAITTRDIRKFDKRIVGVLELLTSRVAKRAPGRRVGSGRS